MVLRNGHRSLHLAPIPKFSTHSNHYSNQRSSNSIFNRRRRRNDSPTFSTSSYSSHSSSLLLIGEEEDRSEDEVIKDSDDQEDLYSESNDDDSDVIFTSSIAGPSNQPYLNRRRHFDDILKEKHKRMKKANRRRRIILQEEEEEEEEDDDEEIERISDSEEERIVEDVCLACRGRCQCGGARGEPIYRSQRNRKIHQRHGGSSRSSSRSTSRSSSQKLSSPPQDDEEEFDGRPRLDLQQRYNSPTVAASTTTTTTTKPSNSSTSSNLIPNFNLPPLPTNNRHNENSNPHPTPSPRPGNSPPPNTTASSTALPPSSSTPSSRNVSFAAPTTTTSTSTPTNLLNVVTPQRLTLRQVLALSAKEAAEKDPSLEDGMELDAGQGFVVQDARSLMKTLDPASSDDESALSHREGDEADDDDVEDDEMTGLEGDDLRVDTFEEEEEEEDVVVEIEAWAKEMKDYYRHQKLEYLQAKEAKRNHFKTLQRRRKERKDAKDVDDEDSEEEEEEEEELEDQIDSRMEKSEERALRKEIELRRKALSGSERGGGGGTSITSSLGFMFGGGTRVRKRQFVLEEDEEDIAAAWEANVQALNAVHARMSARALASSTLEVPNTANHIPSLFSVSPNEFYVNPTQLDEDDELGVTELPDVGGSGVVTWSDYEDLDEFEYVDTEDENDSDTGSTDGHLHKFSYQDGDTEDDDDDDDADDLGKSIAMNFEEELEELLAISESVVGPLRHDEMESGEMWFEAVSDVEGEEKHDDFGDLQLELDNDLDEIDSVHAGDTLLFVDGIEGWTTAAGAIEALRQRAESGFESQDDEAETEEDDDENDEFDEDSDDDIDLLDLNDDGGDTTDSMASDALVSRFGAPCGSKTAPTFEDDLDDPTDSDSERPVFHPMDVVPITPVGQSKKQLDLGGEGKGKDFIQQNQVVESSNISTTPQAPTMGVFIAKRKIPSTKKAVKVVVIDSSDALVPSPFSRSRKSHLDRLTRSTRADSKTSTSTDSISISGETIEAKAEVDVQFDLDELLNDELLESLSSSSATSVSTSMTNGGPKSSKGLSDFARWSRVPIGAFRSRTNPHQVGLSHHHEFDLVKRGTAARSTTLSSPGVTNYSTKRSVEKRMLTSPVMGPSAMSSRLAGGAGGISSMNGKRKSNKRPKHGHVGISPFVAAPKLGPWM